MSGSRPAFPPGHPLPIPDEVIAIARRLEEAGHQAWCVGGALRDALLGGEHTDFDLATSARPEEVQRLFRRTVPVGLKYGTVGVLDARRRLHEVTTFRHDVETDGRHAVVAYGASLEEDLARRDFTINAMAYHPIREEWRDPFDGRVDLAAGLVRAVGEPAQRFREDYLRILRGIRFAARFGFRIDPETWSAAVAAAPGLARLSAERVRDEWFKSLRTARHLADLVRLWHEAGAAGAWLPELATAEAAAALPAALDQEPRDPVLLTVLLTGTPARVLERLRASRAEIARAEAAARAGEPNGTDPVSVRRWLAAAGPAAEDALVLHRLRTGSPAPWADEVQAIRERGDPLARGDLAVSGTDLQAAGVPAGPAIGRVLDQLLARVLEQPELNRREVLLELARSPESGAS